MRRALHVTAVVLLILAGATLLLWLRSYWREDALGVVWDRALGQNRSLIISSFAGRIFVEHRSRGSHFASEPTGVSFVHDSAAPYEVTMLIGDRAFLGFGYAAPNFDPTPYETPLPLRGLMVPHALIASLLVTFPTLRYWHRKRVLRRRCGTCGYYVRIESTRCPECGAALESLPTTSSAIPETSPATRSRPV